jgi:hypothetical protein
MVRRALDGLAQAIGLLTIVPVPRHTPGGGTAPAFFPLVGALIGAIVGGFQIYDKCCADKPAPVSVQYVVDTSQGMAGTISGRRKLDVVKALLLQQVEDEDNVAHGLTLAPPCDGGGRPQRVDVDTGNTDDLEEALGGITPRGTANLGRSIRSAANDLLLQEQQGTERSVLILLVGGRDPCGGGAAALDNALALLQEGNVKLQFRFVGVKAPKSVHQFLKRLRKRAKRAGFPAKVTLATSAADLRTAAESVPTSAPTPESG